MKSENQLIIQWKQPIEIWEAIAMFAAFLEALVREIKEEMCYYKAYKQTKLDIINKGLLCCTE